MSDRGPWDDGPDDPWADGPDDPFLDDAFGDDPLFDDRGPDGPAAPEPPRAGGPPPPSHRQPPGPAPDIGGAELDPEAWRVEGDEDPWVGVAGWSDADFWALARRVRQTAEQEMADLEQETERALLKREDLTARSVRAMMEGERWQVAVGARTIEGVVVHAAMNFVGLQDRAGNLHDVVHSAIAMIRVVGHDPTQGRAPITFRPATFRARLLSLEQLRPVEVAGGRSPWSLRGTIESVNSDHVVLVEPNQQVSLIPIDAIGSISRTPPRHRRHPPGGLRGDRR